jgi:Domain of unknown function (DUF4469) with IG-like fold
VQAELLAGNWVAIEGIGIVTTSIRAKVPTITDPLPADTTVEIGFRADNPLRQRIRAQAQYERIDPADQNPLLLTLTAQTGGGLGGVNAGDVLEFIGDRMKLDPLEADEGIFFEDGTNAPVKVTNYLYIADKRLQFAVPAGLISGGSYTLVVRARRKNSVATRSASWPGVGTAA